MGLVTRAPRNPTGFGPILPDWDSQSSRSGGFGGARVLIYTGLESTQFNRILNPIQGMAKPIRTKNTMGMPIHTSQFTLEMRKNLKGNPILTCLATSGPVRSRIPYHIWIFTIWLLGTLPSNPYWATLSYRTGYYAAGPYTIGFRATRSPYRNSTPYWAAVIKSYRIWAFGLSRPL